MDCDERYQWSFETEAKIVLFVFFLFCRLEWPDHWSGNHTINIWQLSSNIGNVVYVKRGLNWLSFSLDSETDQWEEVTWRHCCLLVHYSFVVHKTTKMVSLSINVRRTLEICHWNKENIGPLYVRNVINFCWQWEVCAKITSNLSFWEVVWNA